MNRALHICTQCQIPGDRSALCFNSWMNMVSVFIAIIYDFKFYLYRIKISVLFFIKPLFPKCWIWHWYVGNTRGTTFIIPCGQNKQHFEINTPIWPMTKRATKHNNCPISLCSHRILYCWPLICHKLRLTGIVLQTYWLLWKFLPPG